MGSLSTSVKRQPLKYLMAQVAQACQWVSRLIISILLRCAQALMQETVFFLCILHYGHTSAQVFRYQIVLVVALSIQRTLLHQASIVMTYIQVYDWAWWVADTNNRGLQVSSNPAARHHVERKVSDGTWSHVPVFIDKPAGKTHFHKQNESPLLATIVRALDIHLSSSVEQLI